MKEVFVYEYLSGGGEEADPELLESGLAMRDAIVADLLASSDCRVTTATGRGAGPVPAVACVAADPGESAFDFVGRQAKRFDLSWVVAPETAGVLARLHDRVDPARWLGCTLDAIVLAGSKHTTLQRLAAQGLCTPLAFEDAPATRGWVVKPDDGAGSVATQVHASLAAARADHAARIAAGERAVLEPWVDGDALSVALLCRAGGAELLSVNRQQIEIGADGRLVYRGVAVNTMVASSPRHAALARFAQQVAAAIPGLRGFVGIDLVWHAARGPVAIEVNPRVTCAYVGLSASLGRNLAAELLAAHTEDEAHAVV